MAAAARSPGIGDARVPCPLCGGLIHPVAGRCKHCKEDLTAYRAGRPPASTPLPPLDGRAAQAPHGVAGAPGTNGHVPAAMPVAVAPREASQPILPPRPTGRSMAAQPPRGLLRNWPILVIVVAVLAIVGAVVIMVLPADDEPQAGKRQLMPTPAPDRMETNPLPKQGRIDPWADPDMPPGTVPRAMPSQPDPYGYDPGPRRAQPRRTPPGSAPSDPFGADPDDVFGGIGGLGTGGARISGTFMVTMLHQACTKLQSCPSADFDVLGPLCGQFRAMPRPPLPANCPAAQRCLDAIDGLSCDADIDNPLAAIALLQDCTTAATKC